MNIAIVGATGNVGRKTLEVFDKKNFKFDDLYLVASEKSAGKKISFRDKEYVIENLETYDFSKADITFFAAGGKIAEKYAEKAAKHTIVIDNSSFFRMDPDVPLIVPQVNAAEIKNMKKNIIANPNCSTAQLVIALKPLHNLFKIKRVVVSTYQSVSGGGKSPMDELIDQTKKYLDGKKIDYLPAAVEDQLKIKPIYKIFDGWKTSTNGIKNITDLPENAKKYIFAIEDFIGAKISSISTSPERDDTILVENPFEI